MKEISLSLFAVFVSLAAMAQATQPCVVKQYNQKEEKTPLAGVVVMVRGAGSTASDQDGRLVLTFRTLKPGDKVEEVEAVKEGYEIMNTETVSQWNISRDQKPFELVMVNSVFFAQLKARLTQTSQNSYKAKYEQAVRELEAQKEAKQIMEEEFNRKYDELEDQYREQRRNLVGYVDQFARIDLSEVTVEEQRILELVQEGQIEEAIQAYDKLELSKKLSGEIDDFLVLDEVMKVVEESRNKKKDNIESLYASIKRQVATLVLLDKFEEARDVLIPAVEGFSKLYDANPDTYRPQLAELEFQLGDILSRYKMYDTFRRAGQYLESSVEKYRVLYDRQPDIYYAPLVHAELRLAGFKKDNLDFDGADILYQGILSFWKKKMEEDNSQFLKEVASTQRELGRLYGEWNGREEEALVYYRDALDSYSRLYEKDPSDSYLLSIAGMKCAIAELYGKQLDAKKEEAFLLDAEKDYRVLLSHDPEYLTDLFSIQKQIADTYDKWYFIYAERFPDKFAEIEKYGTQAESYYRAACLTARKGGDLSFSPWKGLITFYLNQEEIQKAEETVLEYIGIHQEVFPNGGGHYIGIDESLGETFLERGYPEIALPFLTNVLEYSQMLETEDFSGDFRLGQDYVSLAICHAELGDSLKMKESIVDAFRHFEQADRKTVGENNRMFLSLLEMVTAVLDVRLLLIKSVFLRTHQDYGGVHSFDLAFQQEYVHYMMRFHSDVYEIVASAQQSLAQLYYDSHDYNNAEQWYTVASDNYEQLKERHPDEFCQYVDRAADVQNSLGHLYYYTDRHGQAERCFSQSLQYYSLAEDYLRDTSYIALSQNTDPNKYKLSISDAQMFLGYIYYFKKDFENAASNLMDSFNNFNHYYQLHPNEEFGVKQCSYCTEIFFFYTLSLGYLADAEKYDKSLMSVTERYEELYEYMPDNKEYQNRLSYLLHEQLWRSIDKNNADEANGLLIRCQKIGGLSVEENARACNAVAYSFAWEGDFDKALETIDKAIAIMPEIANYYDSKGEILLMKGDGKGALKMWNKVIELDPDFLTKYPAGTELSNGLKEKGLIE